jgi:hypothetical protein
MFQAGEGAMGPNPTLLLRGMWPHGGGHNTPHQTMSCAEGPVPTEQGFWITGNQRVTDEF